MTTQIAVRLPDELVVYVDQQVQSGLAPSRAAAVARALEFQRRREIAERDAAIYLAHGEVKEFEPMVTQLSRSRVDVD
ncbi:MAG: antitoxin [Mycobacteriales bacterium]